MKKLTIGFIPALLSSFCAQGAVKETTKAACPVAVVEFRGVRSETVPGGKVNFGQFRVTNEGPSPLRVEATEAWSLPLAYQRSVSMERQVGREWLTDPVLEELEPPRQIETIQAGSGWTFYQEVDGWVKAFHGSGEALRLALHSREGCTYHSAPFRLPSTEP